jgi:hypothetical protein
MRITTKLENELGEEVSIFVYKQERTNPMRSAMEGFCDILTQGLIG